MIQFDGCAYFSVESTNWKRNLPDSPSSMIQRLPAWGLGLRVERWGVEKNRQEIWLWWVMMLDAFIYEMIHLQSTHMNMLSWLLLNLILVVLVISYCYYYCCYYCYHYCCYCHWYCDGSCYSSYLPDYYRFTRLLLNIIATIVITVILYILFFMIILFFFIFINLKCISYLQSGKYSWPRNVVLLTPWVFHHPARREANHFKGHSEKPEAVWSLS